MPVMVQERAECKALDVWVRLILRGRDVRFGGDRERGKKKTMPPVNKPSCYVVRSTGARPSTQLLVVLSVEPEVLRARPSDLRRTRL